MKTRSSFVCQQCGNESGAWFGKCPSCGAWNSLVETVRVTGKTIFSAKSTTSSVKPLPLAQIKSVRRERISTEMVEFDRVLGGGIVPGVVILIAGDPGVGK